MGILHTCLQSKIKVTVVLAGLLQQYQHLKVLLAQEMEWLLPASLNSKALIAQETLPITKMAVMVVGCLALGNMRDNGVMTNEDYPYTARDENCRHDSSKVYGHVKSYG